MSFSVLVDQCSQYYELFEDILRLNIVLVIKGLQISNCLFNILTAKVMPKNIEGFPTPDVTIIAIRIWGFGKDI